MGFAPRKVPQIVVGTSSVVFSQVFNTYQTYLKVRVVLGLGSTFVVYALCPCAPLRPFARECPLEFSVISIDLGEIWACFGKHLLGCYAIVAMKV